MEIIYKVGMIDIFLSLGVILTSSNDRKSRLFCVVYFDYHECTRGEMELQC